LDNKVTDIIVPLTNLNEYLYNCKSAIQLNHKQQQWKSL